MTFMSVAASIPLRPDPDETSTPILTLDPSDVLRVILTLAAWSKVALTRNGATFQGWLASEDLVASPEATVQLFDEPLGVARETVTGRVEIVVSVANWSKVKVTKADGSISIGWTQEAPQPPQPPAPQSSAEGDDLVLGVNERYRSALLEAQKVTRIDAAALASLIDAEAGAIKSGPDAGVWDAHATNPQSGAAGLTQFLASTWCEMACRSSTRLNAAALQKGLVSNADQIAAGMKAALLDLRYDPGLSILTAAEYGFANLNALQKEGLVAADVGDDERAWFIYLAHHEGLGGAEKFLRKQGSVSFDQLAEQVGHARAGALVSAAGGDVTLAYRNWLTGYMDRKIQPGRFRKAQVSPSKPSGQSSRSLAQLTEMLPLSVLGGRLDLVLEIQQRLSDLGYLDPPADGLLGPTTNWALAEFCKLNALSLNGGFTANRQGPPQSRRASAVPSRRKYLDRPGSRLHGAAESFHLPPPRMQEHHLSRRGRSGRDAEQ